MKEITVELGDRSYPIFIGEDLLAQPGLLSPYIMGEKICIVSNPSVSSLYLNKLTAQLSNYKVSSVIINEGEKYKNIHSFGQIMDHLLSNGVDRKSTVIALGGGVVGDIAGFAAATCLRGINFIQIPTTLLAQVDSSVGGKTGVNHRVGKNLIGAFYQPACVVADLDTLQTLPKREFSAGMAEVIKYGLIRDLDFFNWIEANHRLIIQSEREALTHIVARSCENKAQIVAQDEKESGIRAILNYGHTFGHAIEAAVAYQGWLHGEAIAVGMVMAANMSHQIGNINISTVGRIKAVFQAYDLPIDPPRSMNSQQMCDLMAHDKKTINNQIHLVLLKAIGEAYVSADYSKATLQSVVDQALV